MGKITGFLDYKRLCFDDEPVHQRIKHYKEFTKIPSDEDLSIQGSRCMDCGIPFCHTSFGCPVFNLIPEWNDFVYRNQWQEAFERLEITNNFPEFTGRVCPAPCETACTLSINDSPVTIKKLELAIIEKAFTKGWVIPKKPSVSSKKSVAIIGSGPAGLAAAQELCRFGHEVTIYERMPKPGGILRYGIPDFKLEKWIIDRRLEQLKNEGIHFENGVEIGDDISARYLQKTYGVILIATGAGKSRDINLPGRNLTGIYYAMEYLTQSNKYIDGILTEHEIINAKGKKVVVLGGGDTGSDCVGTAIRQGAHKVYQFEILPKPVEWNQTWNPDWPNWPKILYTSSSQEEGVIRDWEILTKSFSGANGKLTEVNFSRIKWQSDGKNFTEIPGSDFSIQSDLVILALGFLHVEHNQLLDDLKIQYDNKGNIKIDNNYQTSIEGVFAAGDSHTGSSLVVRSIYHGREAASAINEYLFKRR